MSEWVTHWFAYCSAYWQQLVGHAIDIPACKQRLWGTLAVGWEKEGELATTSLEIEFHFQFPYGSPTTELSDFCQTARSGNEWKCKQTLKASAKGNDIITYVISANQHFASTFSMQIFKFQRRSCKLLLRSFTRPTVRAPWRACSQAINIHELIKQTGVNIAQVTGVILPMYHLCSPAVVCLQHDFFAVWQWQL